MSVGKGEWKDIFVCVHTLGSMRKKSPFYHIWRMNSIFLNCWWQCNSVVFRSVGQHGKYVLLPSLPCNYRHWTFFWGQWGKFWVLGETKQWKKNQLSFGEEPDTYSHLMTNTNFVGVFSCWSYQERLLFSHHLWNTAKTNHSSVESFTSIFIRLFSLQGIVWEQQQQRSPVKCSISLRGPRS